MPKKTTNKKMIPYEADEQKALVQWLNIKKIKHTAIPNSTFTTSWKQKRHNTDMGLTPGFPDLVVCAGRLLLFIEMKRKGGSTSKFQKEWIERINKCESHHAVVCVGYEEAVKLISSFV